MLLLLAFACSEAPSEAPATAPAPAEAAPPAEAAAPVSPGTDTMGVDVDAAAAVSVDEIVAAADTWSGKPVTLKGTVKEVCQKKGCWHTIATADPAVNVMVKDKEYQIFLPFDSAGKTAVVKGTFTAEMMPVDEARHFAEDAGRDPSTITEPVKSYLVDAEGIRFL